MLDELNRHGFCTTIYQPPYLYGPNDSQDRANFIWSQIEAGLPVFVPPASETVLIQFLHVADLVQAIMQSLQSAITPGFYNIAGEEKVGLSQWVALVAEAAGLPNPAKEAPAALQEKPARSYFPFRSTTLTLDTTKIADQGFSSSHSLLEGLKLTFAS